MHPLYRIAELRQIEAAAAAKLPAGALMQRAGKAAAQAALALLPSSPPHGKILILAGPGNNGGDALAAAGFLAETGVAVSVLLCGEPTRLPTDAAAALARARTLPLQFIDSLTTAAWALVIDGLFGIGLCRAIDGTYRRLIEQVNQFRCPVLALDAPSGLNTDTGCINGASGCAIKATHTITFIADKPGLYTAAGRDQAGQVIVAALDIDLGDYLPSKYQLGMPELFTAALRPRRHDSHKGSHGSVVVLGGADGMAGAALLAARAALHCGAGRVYAAFAGSVPTHDPVQPELMCRDAGTVGFEGAVIVAGPGLGVGNTAHTILRRALQSNSVLLLDADALNVLAADPSLASTVAQHCRDVVLTPHPLEAARLLGTSAAEVQADRLAAATALAQRYRAIVILKGSGTVLARPDGNLVINPTGNPAMATGGTGDVLAGVCGALLAQHWPVWEAALAAVWLHGRAADNLVAQGCGPIGLTAVELVPEIRRALNQLTPAGRLQS